MGGGGRQGGGGGDAFGERNAMNTGDRTLPNGSMGGVEQTYREGLRDLQQLRRELAAGGQQGPVSGVGGIETDLDSLIRQMQQLDPARFPGNPALLEQLRQQLLPLVENVEIKLRREIDDKSKGQVRTGTGGKIPNGYSEAVADYYRRLSGAK